MKGNKKPHPYYSRKTVRRKIARLLQVEAENAQLRAQLDQITKDQIATLRKIQAELYGGKTR